jgi:hypothetical protein
MKATIIFLFCLLSLQTGATTRGDILKSITNDKVSIFINSIYDEAETVSKEFNLPMGLLIAQACLESGYGSSKLSERCNLLGLKKGGKYAEYETILECFRHWGRTLSQPCYKEIPCDSLNLWLYQLDHCKYHGTPNYGKLIKRIYYKNKLNLLDDFTH